jgi:hypothetical protein
VIVSFKEVVEAAISRFTPAVWATLAPDQQKGAIYEEMRRLDREQAASIERGRRTHLQPQASAT